MMIMIMMMMMVTEAKLTAGSKSFRGSAALNITYSTLPFCAVLSSAPPAMQQEAVPADVPFHAKSHTDHPVRTRGGLSLGHAKPPAARAAPAPAFPRAGDAAAHACKSQRQVTEREQGEDCSPGAGEKRERSARGGQRKESRAAPSRARQRLSCVSSAVGMPMAGFLQGMLESMLGPRCSGIKGCLGTGWR